MSKWNRTYGEDRDGRRTIIITENDPSSDEWRPNLFIRAQYAMIKVCFAIGVIAMLPMLLLRSCGLS